MLPTIKQVRTSEQFYLLAAQSFQDMNDWVNCLRLVAFGETTNGKLQQQQQSFNGVSQAVPLPPIPNANAKRLQQQLKGSSGKESSSSGVDVLLDKRNVPNLSNQAASGIQFNLSAGGANNLGLLQQAGRITTASQALAAASSALAKTRQRQPSLLGSCKPQPPTDSPFIQQQQQQQQPPSSSSSSSAPTQGAPAAPPCSVASDQISSQPLNAIGGQIDTLTPTVRGQLIGIAGNQLAAFVKQQQPVSCNNDNNTISTCEQPLRQQQQQRQHLQHKKVAEAIQATLDEEEENMLYCSIEDNPSEHNYRVKVIESELSLRCQLKCYQLTSPTAVSQQYEQIGNFKPGSGAYQQAPSMGQPASSSEPVTFYQLIIGPQELTLLNDYALGASMSANNNKQQQGLWSWPYQCIRRYGFDKDNCFMFEAGRKCSSGPGQFIVQTPKAYSIYQDVVKFVNELRCVSEATGNTTELPSHQQQHLPMLTAATATATVAPLTKPAEMAGQQSAVTHIPVSWAPESAFDSRRHFFDSLKQLGGQQQQQQQQQPNNGENNFQATSESSTPNGSSSVPLQTARGAASQRPPNYLPPSVHHSAPTHHHRTPLRNPATIPEMCETSSSSSSSCSSSPPSSSSSSLTKNCLAQLEQSKSDLAAQQVAASSNGSSKQSARSNSSDVTSEETDESGYEQGDDSVDSSSSRCRVSSADADLKQRFSMSSASSTSSSASGGVSGSSANGGAGGPPLYSVIQRPRPLLRDTSIERNGSTAPTQQHPAPLSRRWPPLKPTEAKQQRADIVLNTTMRTSNTEKLLSRLVADGATATATATVGRQQDQDFETNLIRDVYSEITKLHATFAVTPYTE